MALEIVRVDSVREAAALLAAGDGAHLLAGGTILAPVANTGGFPVRRMVLADGLGLDTIAIDGGTAEIGATVTMSRLAAEPALGFLKPVAHSIGGPAVRNMATVGGNLFARYPYGDVAVALLALDATVATEDGTSGRTLPLEEFLAAPARGTVVRALRFALPAEGAFRFTKVVRKHPHGASVLSIAAVLPESGGRISGARVAYGAMAAHAMRSRPVEAALEGKALDGTAIAAAVAVATEGCAPQTDPQATDWYRMTVLPVHLGRLLAGEGRS